MFAHSPGHGPEEIAGSDPGISTSLDELALTRERAGNGSDVVRRGWRGGRGGRVAVGGLRAGERGASVGPKGFKPYSYQWLGQRSNVEASWTRGARTKERTVILRYLSI